jgi:hypothetical protein
MTRERRFVLAIFFVALAVCALLTKPRATSWNDTSRLATIDALVTNHTFAIDDSPFASHTKDKYVYRGRTYSDKPPALALQGAGVAFVLGRLGVALDERAPRAIYSITLLTVGVWFALGCAYAFAFARLLGLEPPAAAFVAALTGLGTLALPYATVLANHVPAGAAALAGFYHLIRSRASESTAHAALGALFVALAYAFDASLVVIALGVVVLLWGAPARLWLTVAAVSAPVIAAQLAYNAAVSNGIGPPAMNQASWSDPSSPFYRHDASPFWFASPVEYVRYAAYLLAGGAGLIPYTPLTLLCGYGLARMWTAAGPRRRLALAVASTCIAYFALMVAFTNDYGAQNFGERRFVDIIWLLAIGLGPALEGIRPGIASLAARLAVVASIVLSMLGTIAPFGGPRGQPSAVFAAGEFARLAQRAPVQAAIDLIALTVTIFLVLRFWSKAAAPRSDTARRVA